GSTRYSAQRRFLDDAAVRFARRAGGLYSASSMPNSSDTPCAASTRPLARAAEELRSVHAPQDDQQLRPLVEPRADAVEHGRDVLAHRCPVRAAAAEPDLRRRREETGLLRA